MLTLGGKKGLTDSKSVLVNSKGTVDQAAYPAWPQSSICCCAVVGGILVWRHGVASRLSRCGAYKMQSSAVSRLASGTVGTMHHASHYYYVHAYVLHQINAAEVDDYNEKGSVARRLLCVVAGAAAMFCQKACFYGESYTYTLCPWWYETRAFSPWQEQERSKAGCQCGSLGDVAFGCDR